MKCFYKNWQYGCLPAALFGIAILLSCLHQLSWTVFLIWMQVPFYLVHEFEEHVFPGGFRQFINFKLFESGNANFPLSEAGVFWINIPFIWVLYPLLAILAQHVNPLIGMTLPYFTLLNATTHIIAGLVKRCYNPGLCVSVFLNYPTCIYTIIYLNHHYSHTLMSNIGGFIFALAGHAVILGSIVTKFKRAKTELSISKT
jgi:hypothetical protein